MLLAMDNTFVFINQQYLLIHVIKLFFVHASSGSLNINRCNFWIMHKR